MNQHDYVRGALAYYEENAFHPGDEGKWEDAHYPRPKGLGDNKISLLWEHHQVQGLLQSDEEGRKCFFDGDALRFLRTAAFFEGFFDLWDLYDKWSGFGFQNKEKAMYRNPETGRGELLTAEAAKERGWLGITAGKSPFRNPETGEVALLTSEEASGSGWTSINTGKATFRNPETGEVAQLTCEEATVRGWVGVNSGKAAFRDPATGKVAQLDCKEALERKWIGASKGKGTYRNPETGECAHLTHEEAGERGWVGNTAGIRFKHETVNCPHCGTVGGGGNMTRFHFDNCRHREGSWRWFTAELTEISTNGYH